MWSKQEEISTGTIPGATSAPLATRPLEHRKDATLVPNSPKEEAKPDSPSGASSIGKAVKFAGEIHSNEDLFVDGDLKGTVEATAHKVTIGPNANVEATVQAREVVVLGSLQGKVDATERIEIARSAKMVCDLRTARIHIEDGAFFKGSVDITKPEPLGTPANSQAVVLVNAPNQARIAVGEQTDGGKRRII